MLCPKRQCCDGGRGDYALLTFLAKCNDAHFAVNAVLKDWPSDIIQRCNYNQVHIKATAHVYRGVCNWYIRSWKHNTKAYNSRATVNSHTKYTCRYHLYYCTQHAKLNKSVLDMSPFKNATGTGSVAKMHGLH